MFIRKSSTRSSRPGIRRALQATFARAFQLAFGLVMGIFAPMSFGLAEADVIINNRTGDPPGSHQDCPSICVTHGAAGDNLVAVWTEEETFASGLPRFNFALSQAQPPQSFTDYGAPPAPPGYSWWNDPVVRAYGNDNSGTFYLLGQLRASPLTYAVGFVRGTVTSPTSVEWDTPQILRAFGNSSVSAYTYGNVGMEIDQTFGAVHVVYGNLNPSVPGNAIHHISSWDGGASWSQPAWIGVDSTKTWGPLLWTGGQGYNELAIFWAENPGNGSFVARGISSFDGGNFFFPPYDVISSPSRAQFGPSALGGLEFQMATTVDQSGGAFSGRRIFGLTGVMDLSADTFPDLLSAPAVVEAEPNGTAATANTLPSNLSVIRGTLPVASPADADYFQIPMNAGQTMHAALDSTGNGAYITCAWIGPDGTTVLSQTFNSMPLGFRAPVTEIYYLRLSGHPLATSAYRLRLTSSTAPLPGGRDQRDIMVSTGGLLGPFTGASVLTAPAPGYEESGLAMTWNLDGYVYTSWTEFAVVPGRAISRRVLSRSADGGATWNTPVPLSSVDTDWAPVQQATGSLYGGARAEAQSTGRDMCFSWTDGRNGDPDVYFRGVNRSVYMLDNPTTYASAHPGTTVTVSHQLMNADDLFSFGLHIDGRSNPRLWPFTQGSELLGAGATALVSYTFTVPDTAAPGELVVDLSYRSDKAVSVYASARVYLTVLPPVDVAPGATAPLVLGPVAPNPARGLASLAYSLPRSERMRLSIFSIDGRRVRVLVDGEETAGAHSHIWDGTNQRGQTVSPGAYLVRMETEGHALVRRFVWLR